jgi:hypothetical protein
VWERGIAALTLGGSGAWGLGKLLGGKKELKKKDFFSLSLVTSILW